MKPELLDVLSQIALVAFPALLGIVSWFVRQVFADLKAHVGEMSQAHREAVLRESSQRAVDLALLRRDLEEVDGKVASLQREVDKDYVNFERLEQIIRPLRASLDGMRQEMKDGQRELFNRLDGKQDKP